MGWTGACEVGAFGPCDLLEPPQFAVVRTPDGQRQAAPAGTWTFPARCGAASLAVGWYFVGRTSWLCLIPCNPCREGAAAILAARGDERAKRYQLDRRLVQLSVSPEASQAAARERSHTVAAKRAATRHAAGVNGMSTPTRIAPGCSISMPSRLGSL
jgi:hypothetical protein